MSQPQTVLAHLLEGREELVREIQRLASVIADLDAVIDRVGGSAVRDGLSTPALVPGGSIESAKPSAPPPARRAPTRRPPIRKGPADTAPTQTGGQKSIRVHVLEMLAAEDRDFELSEIIDRIHAAGISAHDDAVRSITIKLMKDGEVERVGRGQYRLARRGSAASNPDGPRHSPGSTDRPATSEPVPDASSPTDGSLAAGDDQQPGAGRPDAAPTLNLAQPWDEPAN